MDPLRWGAPEWGAFGQVGALVVAVVAGAAVWVQVRQGRQVREDQTRPYVIVDFEFKGWWTHLVIKNIGTTPACDVEITFDKELRVPNKTRRVGDFDIFKAPIPMIAPGRVIRVALGAGPDFFKEDADIPLNYTVTATYVDLSGKKEYKDPPLRLDLLPYKNTVVGSDHASDISSTLKDIRQTLKSWTSSGGLRVRARDEDKVQRRIDRVDYRYDARQVLRDAGLRGLMTWQWQRWKSRLLG